MENPAATLATLPTTPGVYIYRDGKGKVLYVGKAVSLRKRVRQYFRKQPHGGRLGLLVCRIETIETLVTGTEREALLLEANLIKRYRPRFNIALKDDKSYPSLRLTVKEAFPRLEVTRRIARDGSLYFGPFTSVTAVRHGAAYLLKAFPLRRCRGPVPGGRGRPGRGCLDFQMGRCLGPCLDASPEAAERYRKVVEELTAFLRGRGKELLKRLRQEMEELSARTRFEEAAVLRDRIHALELVIEGQRVVGDPGDDLDAVGVWSEGEVTEVSCLFVRSGLVVGKRDLLLSGEVGPAASPGSEAVERFLEEQYREGTAIPPRILLPLGMEFSRSWAELLSERAGRKVEVEQPTRGKGYRLLSLAVANAKEALKSAEAGRESATALAAEAAGALHLPVPPLRIEAFDVSHTSGREPYASCVCWREGALAKGDYRLFSLRETDPGDDFAGLAEAITRRLTGSLAGELLPPDLLLIDGGKGQLSRVTALLASLGKGELPAVSISKARTEKRRRPGQGVGEEVWLPGRANPLRFPRTSPVLRLLQLLRDEAHRFALGGHRRRRGKGDLTSALDGIPGVGPARRKALLTRFRSLAEIAAARDEDIAATPGLNLPLARGIKAALKNGTDLS